ncbi:Hfq-like protein [Geothrix fermentans]|jgi:sRNA-binding regulator protein Hfq|uniref:Hfq-like protein n=1 Tax=Geothrix fermentans TaxID=44676 RepID=UPI0004168EAF|nr:RNA chaperone Hfq [Geothrix fermentans]
MNRKLIRPNLSELKDKLGIPAKGGGGEVMTPVPPAMTASGEPNPAVNPAAATAPQGLGSPRRRIAPPEQTNAESFYYLKQMQSKTPMVIVLQDDEKVRGVIEWYDKHCLKINRVKEPNILVPKHNIKYIYKQEEEPRIRRSRPAKKEEPLAPEVEIAAYD